MREKLGDDRGIGLVEVAVAIVVLGIVLVGFLPFLTSSVQLAVKSRTGASANRLVTAQLGIERNYYEANNCELHAAPAWEPVPGAGTADLTVHRRVACAKVREFTRDITNPDGSTGTQTVVITMATVTVRVDSGDYGQNLSQAATEVLSRL